MGGVNKKSQEKIYPEPFLSPSKTHRLKARKQFDLLRKFWHVPIIR